MISSLFQSDQSCEQIFSETYLFFTETCFQTFSSVKNISCDSSLSYNIIDNKNDSQHSNHEILINSVFLKIQMQMLWNIIAQTKKDSYAENHVKVVNSTSWCFNIINLSYCSEQLICYSDRQNICWQHWYNFDLDDLNNSDESVSNILNVFLRCHNDDNTSFCSEKMNFFNLHLDVKNYSIDNIININSKIYF